ncbi:coiled-coil domain-containing protein 186 isoform X2 [Jatropha curcas]|uniref:coiled-coil domain-containing protein 186 isoform X2 n=1 Tax=Jatropha curcas TaxID=180498 RepID=UPI001894146C|nr:coiled-coil domain-containing protein 186 isoform X2 [Jatropha curcas]
MHWPYNNQKSSRLRKQTTGCPDKRSHPLPFFGFFFFGYRFDKTHVLTLYFWREMELLKLSKFKLQLQALTTELRDLREREHSATEQCRILIQKQTEEEYGRKLQELQTELASSNELHQKLERKVNYLQNDNALLENRQKELQGTIQTLLQSRENFVNAYEETTCEMKRAIEARDRKLSLLSEKLNSHLSLFDSIEKEAFLIKQVVNKVQLLVIEKEDVVAGLRSKMDTVSAFEKVFVEKVHCLENQLKNNEDELKRRDNIISELEAQLEAEKIRNSNQTQIGDFQNALLAKDAVIQNLICEKEALHCEVRKLALILQKVKETVIDMDEEDKRVFSSALECQEDCQMVVVDEDNRIEADVIDIGEASLHKACRMGAAENLASPTCQEQHSVGNLQQEKNHLDSCMSESSTSPSHSPCSELQSAVHDSSIAANNGKFIATVHHLDSECSTTRAETSELPDYCLMGAAEEGI